MLRIGQMAALVVLAATLWLLVTLAIRLLPNSLTDPLAGDIAFVMALPGGWMSVWLTKWVGRLSRDQLLPGVAVVGTLAMMMDGAALRWLPDLYSSNDTTVRLSAAWLLWGYGVALGAAVVIALRDQGKLASERTGERNDADPR